MEHPIREDADKLNQEPLEIEVDTGLFKSLMRGIHCGHVLVDNTKPKDVFALGQDVNLGGRVKSFDWQAFIISIAELLLKLLKSWLLK